MFAHFEAGPGADQDGAILGHGVFGSAAFLKQAQLLAVVQLRLGHLGLGLHDDGGQLGDAGLAGANSGAVIGIIEAAEELSGRDDLAFGDGHFDDFGDDFGADVHFLEGFDLAGGLDSADDFALLGLGGLDQDLHGVGDVEQALAIAGADIAVEQEDAADDGAEDEDSDDRFHGQLRLSGPRRSAGRSAMLADRLRGRPGLPGRWRRRVRRARRRR